MPAATSSARLEAVHERLRSALASDLRGHDRAHERDPIVPPTWRALFRTAAPTPDLSTGTLRVAAAALGVMVSDIPTPPMMSAGRSSQKDESSPSREKMRSWTGDEDHPCGHEAPRPDAVARLPASGATRMISIVIGRKAAPACTAE